MAKHLSISNSEAIRIALRLTGCVVLFLTLNLLIYFPLSSMYFHSYGGKSGAQINNVLRQKSDIFIFGASRASHHYDPEIIEQATGLTAFNAGDDGKNSVYQLGLLKMLMKRHRPKMIIYEVGDLTRMLDGGTIDLLPYYYRDNEIKQILNKRDAYAPVKLAFPLYAYNEKILNITSGYMSGAETFSTGFRPIVGKMAKEEINKISKDRAPENRGTDLDPLALSCFNEFASTCRKEKIEMLFVYSPSYIGSLPAGQRFIGSIAHKYRIPFYDYSANPIFVRNNILFKDSNHLNVIGARIFTTDLVKHIRKPL